MPIARGPHSDAPGPGEIGRAGRLPYLALGEGAPLVFLSGLLPDAGVETPTMRRIAARTVAPFAERRRVLFFNRRARLARGSTMSDLASEHAEALAALGHGPVDVVGSSTGGSIAQQLAADHPEAVRRLVLFSTACRLPPHAVALQGRVATLIRRGASRRAFATLVAGLVPPWRGRAPAAAAAALLLPRVFPDVQGLADMATTIEAENEFDLAALGPIRAPTLIVAGAEDRLYGPHVFGETAALIRDSRLVLVPGKGHVSVASDPRALRAIDEFLGR
jgi:pimeloyl-ACP methyl ester carboxylesterase